MASAKKMPMLPGYSVNIDHINKTSHAKKQTFNFKNGMAVISEGTAALASELLPNAVRDPLVYDESRTDPTAVMSQVPAWVAYDRKVLRFYAYYTESVPQSPIETERVRKVIIYFYLEDDSIHIAEARTENSGLPQGVFLKRHRIPKSAAEFFTIDDLRLGTDLIVYGRPLHVYDCDPFSRAFFESLSVDVGQSEEVPMDAYALKEARKRGGKHVPVKPNGDVNHGKPIHPMKTYMEASLGKSVGKSVEQVRQFLEQDRLVLRFYCLWHDPALYGETRPYVLNYFLADDTVEVMEVSSSMSGRDPFPALLKKQRLPKRDVGIVGDAGAPESSDADFYAAADFMVGATVNVYGRAFFIYAVDEFTKEYLKRRMGKTDADFPAVREAAAPKKVAQREPPPHNGYGTEEDSLGSVYNLVPKQPKKDWGKLTAFDKKKMLIAATLVSDRHEDQGRQFVITYHLCDDEVQIDEKQRRNSGFWTGKFLNKERLRNAATGAWFKPTDFGVGKRVTINTFVFDCYEVDSYTAQFLAAATREQSEASAKSAIAGQLAAHGASA